MSLKKSFSSFAEFWPFYLSQHQNVLCRKMHFLGTLLAGIFIGVGAVSGKWFFFLAAPLVGYGFAWWGHFAFEKNKPATFQYPWYSFLGDLKMFGVELMKVISFFK